MKPKEITNIIKLPDGRELPLTTEHEDIAILRKYLREAKEDYRVNPNRRNYIVLQHAQAAVKDSLGKTEEAATELLLTLNLDNLNTLYPDADEKMKSLVSYLVAASFLVELLLRIDRIDEALEWADRIRLLADDYFPGTSEIPFAMGIYACCLEVSGEKSNAAYMYESTVSKIDEMIAELESFRESIKSNLDGLWN